MPEVNHGPLPWSRLKGFSSEHIFDAKEQMVADCCRGTREFGQANAALIVEAVNHHGHLVRAVKLALKMFLDLRQVMVQFVAPDRTVEHLDAVIETLKVCLPEENKEAA